MIHSSNNRQEILLNYIDGFKKVREVKILDIISKLRKRLPISCISNDSFEYKFMKVTIIPQKNLRGSVLCSVIIERPPTPLEESRLNATKLIPHNSASKHDELVELEYQTGCNLRRTYDLVYLKVRPIIKAIKCAETDFYNTMDVVPDLRLSYTKGD